MSTKTICFIALFFVAVALGPALAHLLELPNKIDLAREEYLTVQQIYRGWALLGIVVAGALLSTLILAVRVRKQRKLFFSRSSLFFASWERKSFFGHIPIPQIK